jgi:glycosyltransferase involved in cell wall biosynthesis
MTKTKKVSLVIPVFNEKDAIAIFIESINDTFKKTDICLEFIFVNDGSTDESLDILIKERGVGGGADSRITILDLSRNFGKEAALSAGLEYATGDCVVPIDVDLQDPPELILEMIEKWNAGFDVVIAKRIDRSLDSWAKRNSSLWFYYIYNKIAQIKIPENVGDFRLMDRSVVDAVKLMPESNRFMKGIFSWVGFKTTYVEYSRPNRVAGSSKFSGWKLWNFAIEGITSFSSEPLRIWTYLGLVVASISFFFATFIIFNTLIYGTSVPGYSSLAVLVTFLGGIQLIGIGVLGEYLGRAYIESKRRPIFIVRKIYKKEDKDGS